MEEKIETVVKTPGVIMEEGIEAFRSLRRSTKRAFPSWLLVGHGLEAGRTELMRRLHLNDLEQNRLGKKAYAVWLKESGYAEVPSEARRALLSICEPENLPRIKAWYQTLSEKQKFRTNHPVVIWRNWQASIGSKTRTNPVLVRMIVDSKGTITQSISRETATAQLDDYLGLAANIVGFLSKKYGESVTDILELIAVLVAENEEKQAEAAD